MAKNLNKLLERYSCKLISSVSQYSQSKLINNRGIDISGEQFQKTSIMVENAQWGVTCKETEISNKIIDLQVKFDLLAGECKQSNLNLSLEFQMWSKLNYVLMPGAAYNGNRFESRKLSYPPFLIDEKDIGIDIPNFITDVPRLNIREGRSKIQQMSGDMTTPAIGFHDPAAGNGFWLLTEQATNLGDSLISIEESTDRSKAVITVSAPGVRDIYKYTLCDTEYTSEDKAADFKTGDSIELHIRLYFFNCPDIQGLFNYFVEIRKDLSGEVKFYSQIPFSSAWKIQEEKFNRENWESELGYYSVGMRENIHQDWQVGWVGGMMVTYPLLFESSKLSTERVLRNFHFLFNGGQSKSGFFYGCGHKGEWYGDCFYNMDKNCHLLRKSGDALYYILKQFMLLKLKDNTFKIPEKWLEGTKKCADAFMNLWNRYGQLGQFVDTQSGELLIGGSCSAAIVPAGLALAYQFYGELEYLEKAGQIASYFYKNFVRKGYTTGGPGEICQCPDAESAFGLLESFIVLYEATEDKSWLGKAVDIANICMTWCVSYDFKFPMEATFGKMDMHTAGTVYANVQNKHSAPGICTHSGSSIFKLYRYTGNSKYLELIKEIAHAIPQYLSREDRPIKTSDGRNLPVGWMNERVEMSDWLEPLGEIFYGSCWCEVSNMLTYVEVPGLYVQPDTGFVCTIDHVEVTSIIKFENSIQFEIINTTEFKASIKVYVENMEDMKVLLGQNFLYNCCKIELEPGERKVVTFFRS